jgi:hypothetical protein
MFDGNSRWTVWRFRETRLDDDALYRWFRRSLLAKDASDTSQKVRCGSSESACEKMESKRKSSYKL